ncbi:MAG: 50S ribosomal protein L10 [Acidaminococcaceae bacterium]|nr:50S ribosomal protein L10 [Acidaminococcaceae bacterium]MDD4723032.1 50S ribosomal protein L10 [Acidaminococcaceae bacterium]
MHSIRPEKASKVTEIKEILSSAKCIVLVNYCGLTVAEDTKLRSSMRTAGVKYTVVKNTLLRIAAKEAGIEGMDAYLEHNTAIAVAPEDPVEVAKILNDFAKVHKALEVKAGVLDGKMITTDDIKALAALPSREVLLAKMLGSMQAPISGLVNVLQGTIRNFVYVLDAVRKEKESA